MSDRIEIDGIDVPCDYGKLEDIRFLLLLGDLDDDELDDSEKLAAMSRLTRYLFGSERGAIVAKLAQANGGALDPKQFTAWLVKYLAEVGAKN
jgi:hypothetical protein